MIQTPSRAGTGGDTRAEAIRRVLHLTRLELRRTRRAYLIAVAVALVMGLAAPRLLAASFGADSPAGALSAVVLNLFFLLWVGVLPRTGAWVSTDQSGAVTKPLASDGHVAFLRTLPLTVGQVVTGRAAVACFFVLSLTAALLAPLYLLSETLRGQLGAGGLLLFAAFWIGVGLAFEAVGLFTELGFGGWAGFLSYIFLIGFFGGYSTYIAEEGTNAVEAVVGLTRERGVLPALVALLAGGGLLALSGWATERRVRRGERSA